MKFNCQWIKQHRFLIVQIALFAMGKLFIGLIQLPSYEKQETYMVFLAFAVLFYLCSIILKLYSHGKEILKRLLAINIRLFLIWMVSILNMIFTFSLCHALKWYLIEIAFVLFCQFLQTSILVILCYWCYISKIQFIVYEFLLCLNIFALGIKTVIFIEFQSESHNKDIVLLNLTTQIALAVLIMDAMDRAYSRFCKNTKEFQKKARELQMTINT